MVTKLTKKLVREVVSFYNFIKDGVDFINFLTYKQYDVKCGNL